MKFAFPCLVIRHVSGRVTVAPLDHPALTTHANALEVALEDLSLAFDDRIARAHPMHLAGYVHPWQFEVLSLRVPTVPIWGSEGPSEDAAVDFTALKRPAHAGFVEVQIPRLDLRTWVQGNLPLEAEVLPILRSVIAPLDDDARLALRNEGQETLETLHLEATPTTLNTLRHKELYLDERPPPRPDDETPAVDDGDEERPRSPPSEPRTATPTLRSIAVPLHRLAQQGRLDPAFLRDALVQRISARLALERPDPLVLVGSSGIGKSAAIDEVVRGLAAAKNPRPVFALDASRLIAGEGGFGSWEAQLHQVLEEARKAGAILVLGHIVELLDAGRSAHSDHNVALVLGPVLAAREIAVIGEATPEAWALLQRRNASFAAVWSPLQVEEASEADTLTTVTRVLAAAAAGRGIGLGPGTVERCVALVRRFWPYGAVVGNAVTFARRLLGTQAHARADEVTADDATALFSAESGIPLPMLDDRLPLDLAAVQDFLNARVHAQPRAVARAAQVIAVIKAGLSDRRRPIANLFFAGPTGVGKTELARALAEFIFNDRERMVRLDMGEYLSGDAVARLLGSETEPGALPRAVRRQPFCVVLLDEIEKAHSAVFDALLGVLGEARLTDAAGRTTDFRNALIVMTSNLGAETLRGRVGFGEDPATEADRARRHYTAEAQRFFRPELFNRLDDLVVFDPLDAAALHGIARREVQRIRSREGLHRRDVQLEVDDDALALLTARGHDPRYGARPLKRTLERELVAPVARWLAEHPKTGPVRVAVTAREGRLVPRATSLSGTAEGSRAEAAAVLEQAAELRVLARRLGSSWSAQDLRNTVAWFNQNSRNPAFWTDATTARRLATQAERAQSILARIETARRTAEATEDLAVEAWWSRQQEGLAGLRSDLAGLRRSLDPIGLDLFLTVRPPTSAGVLYLVAARTAWHRVAQLAQGYLHWAKARAIAATCWVADPIQNPGRAAHGKNAAAPEGIWVKREPQADDAPAPFCTGIIFQQGPRCAMLEGETGIHRFNVGSRTEIVRVHWRPSPEGPFAPTLLTPVSRAVEESAPLPEIRRYNLAKMTVRDLRTRVETPLATHEGRIDPAALIEAWARFIALDGTGDPWS